jgi:hypothetical protein
MAVEFSGSAQQQTEAAFDGRNSSQRDIQLKENLTQVDNDFPSVTR